MVVAALALGMTACGDNGSTEPGEVDCNKTPTDALCELKCSVDPLLPYCPLDCERTPLRDECPADCEAHPNDVRCAVDCTETPDHADCAVDCDVTPEHRSCQDMAEWCDEDRYTLPPVRTGLCLADEEYYRDASAPGGAFERKGTDCTIASGILAENPDVAAATASIACCLGAAAEVSPDCASCAAEVAVCSAQHCKAQCSLDPNSTSCATCRLENNCEARLNACTGLDL